MTTDERWDASRDVMHHLEGETTCSEEITTKSESMTRANYSIIALNAFMYQPGARFVGFMNVSSATLKQEVLKKIILQSDEIPESRFDKLKDYITLHQAPKRPSASRSGFKDSFLPGFF